MPVNGLVFECDILELGVAVPSSLSPATLTSLWTPDAIDVWSYGFPDFQTDGVIITIEPSTTSTQGYVVICPGCPFEGYRGTASGPLSVYVDFINWKVYGINPGGINYLFRVQWDSINVIVNGTTVVSFAGNNVESQALGPSWIPVFCGYVTVASNGFIGSGFIDGGWRYSIGGTWYSPPVTVPPISAEPPSVAPGQVGGTCPPPFNLSFTDVVVATSTWGNLLSLESSNVTTYWPDGYVKTVATYASSGSVTLVPNLPKSIQRMNMDFAATFFAYATPATWSIGTRMWFVEGIAPSTDGNNPIISAYESASGRIAPGTQEVGYVPGFIEAMFGIPSYCPCTVQIAQSYLTNSDGMGALTDQIEEIQFAFPGSMDYSPGLAGLGLDWTVPPAQEADVAAYMAHADVRFNYFNSAVCHPHWSIGYYTGPWCLGSDCAPSLSEGVFHIQDDLGRLHIATVIGGDVFYQRADFSNPLNGWATEQTVTSYGDVKLARMFVDHNADINLVVTRKNATSGNLSSWRLVSTDEGHSFGDATEVMTGAIWTQGWDEKSVGAAGITGFTYNSGSSGAGTQSAIYRDGPVGVSWSSSFTFLDQTNAPIPVSDGGWANVQPASDGSRNLSWTPVINGETAASEWLSVDNARTWRRIF
jgi:hypothetical protein